MKPLFCSNYHKRVISPKFLNNVKVQGTLKINCGDTNCKGIVVIKNKTEENKTEEIKVDNKVEIN